MNILIVGGLLGLAVVALLGAVLLGVSEDKAEKAEAAHTQPAQTGQLSAASTTQTLPSTPVVVRATSQLALPNEEESFAILNGQVHEITGELRALAHKAGELELRLNNLSEVLERQQYRPTDMSGQFYPPRTDVSPLS